MVDKFTKLSKKCVPLSAEDKAKSEAELKAENDKDLERFVLAQRDTYAAALAEIKNGRKLGHWMWYIFPQLRGLGLSEYSVFYGISGIAEAQNYLSHPILFARLIEITEELLKLKTNNATEIFGSPDDLKLKSSMTLFCATRPDIKIFEEVLNKFFSGKRDENTVQMIR